MAKTLVLIAPGLLATGDDAFAKRPALATLARYAGTNARRARDVFAASFAAIGLPDDTPAGPLALLGSGADPRDDFVVCAQPVHVEMGAGHAIALSVPPELDAAQAASLVQTLDRHFADDDLRFTTLRADAWIARRHAGSDVTLTAPDAAHDLRASLPAGGDAARWRRWQDEIAMLLHEHDVNRAREAAGLPPVNGVWFFGGGVLRDVAPPPPVVVVAPHGLLGEALRGAARLAAPAGRSEAVELRDAVALASARERDAARPVSIVAMIADRGDTQAIDHAVAHLERGDVDTLHLVAGGAGRVLAWTAHRPGRWRRLAARLRLRPRAAAVPPQDAR